jgi:hypothetical protein
MAQTPPPTGYLNRKVAQSAEEAIAKYTADHIKTIVKATIQKYIESFFNTNGGNREIFKTLSKMGLQYITDKSFDASSDPTLRKTQLARMFEQVRQELPCMLIMDSGFEYIHQNWTGLDRVWKNQGEWYASVLISRNLKITLACGTRDQSSTDFLHGLLSVLFGEYRFISQGQRITGNYEIGETWVVKIGTPTLGTVTQQPVGEDPKDRIWMFNIDIENVWFEDNVSFKQPIAPQPAPQGSQPPGALNTSLLGWTAPVIYMPDTIPLNQPTQVRFDLFQPQFHRIIVVDPNIATIQTQSRILSPRRLGTTQLQVVRIRMDNEAEQANQTGAKDVVVASQTFTVTRT